MQQDAQTIWNKPLVGQERWNVLSIVMPKCQRLKAAPLVVVLQWYNPGLVKSTPDEMFSVGYSEQPLMMQQLDTDAQTI